MFDSPREEILRDLSYAASVSYRKLPVAWKPNLSVQNRIAVINGKGLRPKYSTIVTMTQDFFKAENTKRYDIPLTHLDYGYVRECNDVKELEKILRILRSGDEGCFPDLERETEGRLESLNPKSRVLRKDNPPTRLDDLDKTERENLSHDMEKWKSEMANKEDIFSSKVVTMTPTAEDEASAFDDDPNLPPVRSGKVISKDGKVKDAAATASEKGTKKKVMPRSYKEWDKFDIDKELEKAEEEQPSKKKQDNVPSSFKPEGISHKIDTEGMTVEEKSAKAMREKEKGNEAFHAHDYEESLVYYSRSLSIAPLAATFNNRALAYLRLEKWKEAINDCSSVLKSEPKNVKALLRRGTALKGRQDLVAARTDLEAVLALEPNNKTAQDQLKEIEKVEKKAMKEKEERKEKGRRMIIEEVEGSDEENNDDDVTEEIIVEKPEKKKGGATLMNGHAEEMTSMASGQETLAESAEETSAPSKVKSQEPKEQEEDSKSKDNTKKNKDIWTAEETPPPQQQQTAADDKKPKLVTTSILSDQWQPVPGTKGHSHTQKSANKQKGAGDSEKINGSLSSTESFGDSSQNKSCVEKVAEAVQNGQGDAAEPASSSEEEESAVENEPVHSRPVFMQRAFLPNDAGLREKGNNFFRSGQYPEAIKIYTTLIDRVKKAPDQVVNLSLIYSNRAACHLKTGDCQSAISDCTTSLSLVAHSAKPLLRRASAYETMEKYRQAYVDYKHVITVDATSALAHEGASRCQKHLRDIDGNQWRDKLPPLVRVSQWDIPEIIDEAASTERERVQQKQSVTAPSQQKETPKTFSPKPQNTAVAKETPVRKALSPEEQFEETKAQGNKHVQKGEYEAAAKCYCQCVGLFTDRTAVYTNRALCYLKLSKAKEAEADCSTALTLEPNNSKAFYRRALARKEQKHYKESLQDLLQLLRLEPANGAAKKEMEMVKKLYKQEYDQLKGQPAATEKQKPTEKQRKRMKIVEVDDDSDSEKKENQPHQTSSTIPQASAPQSTQLPPSQSQAASDKQSTAAPRPQQDSRKPGRSKSKKSGAKETSVGLPVTPPSAPKLQGKITPFEFIQHWNSLKQAKEIQPYVQLLEQISPDDLPGVISNKLDGHMLQIISRCAAHDAQTGEVERAYSILHNVRQVPRFTTVSMFLSNKEKQDIRKVLETISSLGTHSSEEVSSVRRDYGVK